MNNYESGYNHIMKVAKLDLSKWHDLHPATRNAIGLGAAGGAIGTGSFGIDTLINDRKPDWTKPAVGGAVTAALGAATGKGWRHAFPILPSKHVIPGVLGEEVPVGLRVQEPRSILGAPEHQITRVDGANPIDVPVHRRSSAAPEKWELQNMDFWSEGVPTHSYSVPNYAVPTLPLDNRLSARHSVDRNTIDRVGRDPNLLWNAKAYIDGAWNEGIGHRWAPPMVDDIGTVKRPGISYHGHLDDVQYDPHIGDEANEARRLLRTQFKGKINDRGWATITGEEGQALRDRLGLGYFER